MSSENVEKKKNPTIKEVLSEKDQKLRDEKYNKYVKNKTPKNSCIVNVVWAFIIGGLICVVGQFIMNLYMGFEFEKDTAAAYTSLTLIGLSVIMTGFNLYSKLCKLGGAGTVVPITGFANSVASSALEYKREGQVFGIGCKIFTIAGPVILYGIFSSWILGVIYYILKLIHVV